MLYAIYAHDKPNSVDLRMSVRPTHLSFIDESGTTGKIAGPILAEDEKTPIGSILIVEAENAEAAAAWAAQDPYAQAGLFESVAITPWKWVIGNPEA